MVTHTDDRTRGQVILIGAIALAFIILGVVVVFNGVLYTETVSSGPSSQSASTANVTATEVEQSVGCLLATYQSEEENDLLSGTDPKENITNEIHTLNEHYQEVNARATPTIRNISVDEAGTDIDIDTSSGVINSAEVTVTSDSNGMSYERTQRIEPSDCPDDDL